MPKQEIIIHPELENMLLEFTINVLVENPEDLVNHAADYFIELREKRKREAEEEEASMEEIRQILGPRRSRRGTVMGERYNPEDDADDDDDEIEIYPKSDEQRKRIKERIKGIFLFRVLDDVDLAAVIDAMIPKEVKAGELIIQQGDDGDFFYLIDNGHFDIYIKDGDGNEKYIATYENEGFFGELALLHNQPRAATIKAASDGFLWAVGRTTFNKLIVKRAFEKRQTYTNLLQKTPQLQGLTEYEAMQVADALVGKSFKKGDVIVQEGDEGDGMYFIVEGKVSVRKGDKEIVQLGAGQFFGEMALVQNQPRAASVVAIEDTSAAFLDVKAFERLLGSCLDVMKRHIESYK